MSKGEKDESWGQWVQNYPVGAGEKWIALCVLIRSLHLFNLIYLFVYYSFILVAERASFFLFDMSIQVIFIFYICLICFYLFYF